MFKKYKILFLSIAILFQIIFSLKNIFKNSINPTEYIYPSDTTIISSEYGYRDLFGKTNFHNGIDFPMPRGSNVYAIANGIVKSCGFIKGYGISITILHPNNYISLYAHLDENVNDFVTIGKRINQGDIIANVGPKYLSNGILNGLTTGPHLHFTVFDQNHKTINPLSLNLKKKSNV